MNHDRKRRTDESMKREIARKPGKDDVHEQREPAQPREGVVHVAPKRVPPPPNPNRRR